MSIELLDKWLHSRVDGTNKSVIETLIDMPLHYFAEVDISEFQKLDNSIKSITECVVRLNQLFKSHEYPFKANYRGRRIYIKQSKPMFCLLHRIKFKTEKDLKEHQRCKFVSVVPIENKQENIIIDKKSRETEEKRQRKLEELRKSLDTWV
jgi:hypothetical protein